jgi:hypothetical protein
MDKNALLERLVRLGATDIPGTPRAIMRQRSPEELAQLQQNVGGLFKRYEEPAKEWVGKKLNVPAAGGGALGWLKRRAQSGANLLIENPETLPMQPVPVPFLTPAYLGVKKGLEALIDKVAPVPKIAFATSQYSTPLNPVIESGASYQPGFRSPQLRRGIQKNSGETTMPLSEKYAALDEKEKDLFRRAVRMHAEFDRRSGGGEDVAEAMRANVERIGHLKKKKVDDAYKIPGWVHDLGGKPPPPPPPRASASSGSYWNPRWDRSVYQPPSPPAPPAHWYSPGSKFWRAAPVVAPIALPLAFVGAGALADYIGDRRQKKKEEAARQQQQQGVKAAASAPTRGNFMMASDLPPFRSPQLRVGVQKEGDMLPDGVTYGPSDFKKSKYAFMDESNPYLRKALIGALGGMVAGGLGGVGHELFRPTPRIPVSTWAQALDDVAPDTFYEAGKALDPSAAKAREAVVSRVGRVARKGRDLSVEGMGPHDRVTATGRHIVVSVLRPEVSVGGRLAPLVLHADRREGTPAELLARARQEAAIGGKYAMPTEDLEAYVAWLRKEADVSPAVTWSGATGVPHRQESDLPPFRTPRLDRGIQKQGMTPASQLEKSTHIGAPRASAPPGPSIKDIAKPKGAHFGTGIAGAFKNGIGGTAPVGLK